MANVASSGGSGLVTSGTVENVSLPAADTEVSHTLPTGTKQYTIQLRGKGILKISTASGQSGTTYWELYPGQPIERSGYRGSTDITLYMQSSKAGDTVELWSEQ